MSLPLGEASSGSGSGADANPTTFRADHFVSMTNRKHATSNSTPKAPAAPMTPHAIAVASEGVGTTTGSIARSAPPLHLVSAAAAGDFVALARRTDEYVVASWYIHHIIISASLSCVSLCACLF